MTRAVLSRKSESELAPTIKAARTTRPGGLRVGEPYATSESDAERMADSVASGGVTRPAWSASRFTILPAVQGKSAAETVVGDCAPPVVHEVLNSPGQPLDGATRAFFESSFGHDFSCVRVHTNTRAAESAHAVQASAYAVGPHVVFAAGGYAPHTASGRHLLAHELAHVVQKESMPVLRRQPKDQPAAGEMRPLVKKFLDGQATAEEKATLQKMLVNNQLSPAEVEALENSVKEAFKTKVQEAITGVAKPAAQLNVTFPKSAQDVHKFFKARLQLRLTGMAKALASGLEGTVETTVEVTGSKQAKTVTVKVAPPEGDTSLAALIRTKAFPNGPVVFALGETALKALNMVSIKGDLTFTVTGNKNAEGGGLVIVSPEVPESASLTVTVSESAEQPAVAASTGAPALPSPRAFVTGGMGGAPQNASSGPGPSQTVGAATVGLDVPLYTDTMNPLIYGGLGLRGTVDTRGALSSTGAVIVGAHLSPLTVQLALEAGVGRIPGSGTGTDSGAKSGAVFGAEVSASYQVLKRVEIMALASAIGGKDVPIAGSLQAGAALHF